jgi:serine/threonine protein phosphatase 1
MTDKTIYAIGDIHGEFDALMGILNWIKDDALKEACLKPRLICLGDYGDRGPKTKQVYNLFVSEIFSDMFDHTLLIGNHDALLYNLTCLYDQFNLYKKDFLTYGGIETLESYSDVRLGNEIHHKTLIGSLIEQLPEKHFNLIKNMHPLIKIGNYVFVHAGIDYNHLDESGNLTKCTDQEFFHACTTIRKPFLEYNKYHGFIVVHGHSVTRSKTVEIYSNRIAVDTGACYEGGYLSVVAIRPDGTYDTHSVKGSKWQN